MKKFYYLSLLTLLFVVGGVNMSAQTFDFEAWAKSGNAQITAGDAYINDKNIYPSGTTNVNYWKSIGENFDVDVSRFATRFYNNQGWYFYTDDNGNGGLKATTSYPVLVISKLLSGDEIEFVYDGEIYLYAVTYGNALGGTGALTGKTDKDGEDGDELKTKRTDKEINNGSVTIKITANCDLIVEGTTNESWKSPLLKKITINRKDKAEYGISDDKDYETPYYEFVAPGKVDNNDRVITDIFGINVTLGNIDKTNNVEVINDATNGCGVMIYDDNNYPWLWANGDDNSIDYYHQGTFYKFEPTVSGTLTVDGFCTGQNDVYLVEYENKDGVWSKVNKTTIADQNHWTASLLADHVYYLYAQIIETYCLKGFTYESNFHFQKKSVVIDDELKDSEIVSVDGESTTYYANKDITQTGDESSRSQVIEGDGVSYSFEAKGDVTITDKDDTNGTFVSWSNESKGGAIVVTATHEGETTQYVITIPYYTNEWVFNETESKNELYANTAGKKLDWDLAWKVYRYKDGTTLYNELSHPVFSNAVRVEGDNARFIDATAGLLFDAPSKHFGTNTSVTPPLDTAGKNDEELDSYLRGVYWSYNLEDNVIDGEDVDETYVPNKGNAITMQVGTKLTIPNLKPGQHIRIRWNRHNNNNGELVRAFNVTDLEGTSMDGMLFNIGAGSNSTRSGHQEFIVENAGEPTDKETRVNVTFELVRNGSYYQGNGDTPTIVSGQQGWANISNIKVGPAEENFYFDTHMRPRYTATDGFTNPTNTFGDTNVKEDKGDTGFIRDAIYTYLRKKTDVIKTQFSTNKEDIRTQSGGQVDSYHIFGDNEKETEAKGDSRTGTLNSDNCKIVNNILEVAPNAHGSFTLVQESRQGTTTPSNSYCLYPYLLDSLHVKVNVYEYDYNVKKYPYTWAMEHFTTDTGNNTEEELANDKQVATWDKDESGKNKTISYWTKKNDYYQNGYYQFNVGYPENMIAWKQRKTEDADGEVFVPELDGLGFIPEKYWDNHDDNVKLQPIHTGIILSGDNNYQLIVPNVGKGETVYLAVTGDTDQSSVKLKAGDTETPLAREAYTGSVYVDEYKKDGKYEDYNYENGSYYKDDENNPIHIYKIEGNNGDVNLVLQNLTVHKVAVSVDTKEVTAAGYATEAREYPIDFTLANLFLGEEQKAYKVINVDKDGDMPNVTVSEVRYIPATTTDDVMNDPNVNNGVMITGDYLPERAKREPTTWPLFTTDIDRATSDMSGNLLVGVVAQSSIKDNLDDRTLENDGYYYNYMLAEQGYSVEYDSEEITDESIGKATSRVTGLGYYLALKKGTDMSAVGGVSSYPGGKPKDNSAYLKLGEKSAKINEFAEKDKGDNAVQQTSMYVNSEGLFQVFFIDADSIATDIEDVPIDDELPTSDDAVKALHNGVFYTLQGVAVKNPTKGIYIFNGKKVYVK